jgi:hypothetical protein
MKAALSLLFLSLLFGSHPTSSFSSGAGGCKQGEPSIQGAHLTKGTITNGTLADGGYEMKVRSNTVQRTALVTVGPFQFSHPFRVSGDQGFKGILVLFTDIFDTDAEIQLTPGDGLKHPPNCPDQMALTHTNATTKSSVDFVMQVDDEIVTDVDVTVVKENSRGVSEYYYSSFKLQFINKFPSEFINDCIDYILQADADNNLVLDRTEYFNLITLLGQESKCYTPAASGSLSNTQEMTFSAIACSICLRNGGEPMACCLDPTELPITAADTPNDRTPLERRHLGTICQFTYADIPPSCGSSQVEQATLEFGD